MRVRIKTKRTELHGKVRIILPSILVSILQILCAQEPSTWKIIQEHILNLSCVGCHAEGTYFASQSGLVLTEDVAYDQLVNVVPHNTSAYDNGLVRVSTSGLSGLHDSFLWEKINALNEEHFYEDHPYYGTLMPLGLPYLTNGELAFVKEWILAQAPEDGVVADTSLLSDTTRYEPQAFHALPEPENGIQYHLGPFDVPPDFERELFYYVPFGSTDDIYITRVEMIMRPGSHHFIAYSFLDDTPDWILPDPYVYRELHDIDGSTNMETLLTMLYHGFSIRTPLNGLDYHFPPGTALRLDGTKGLDLNSHYINRTNIPYSGEVYLNIHLKNADEVDRVAEVMVLNNLFIYLPPNEVTTITKTFWVDDFSTKPVNIFMMHSHAHKHMLEFKAEVVGGEQNGELVYISYDWEHPIMFELNPPLRLEPDQGIKLIATYDNWTDQALLFGFLSEDEMMILYGYYYIDTEDNNDEDVLPMPQTFTLRQNYQSYPNPTNATITFEFFVSKSGLVTLKVYDILGKQIQVIVNQHMNPGYHSVQWNIRDIRTDIYFVRIESGNLYHTQKVMVLK